MWSDKILNFGEPVEMDPRTHEVLKGTCHDARKKYEKLKSLDPKSLAEDQNKLKELMGDRDSTSPDYDDPKMVRAYLWTYHVHHIFMVYQIFTTVLRRVDLSDFDHIYVCDVGSGIGAGLVGLRFSLEHDKNRKTIHFDAVEISKEMVEADRYFYSCLYNWRNFSSNHHIKRKQFQVSLLDVPVLPENTIKLVSAFHLTWPYDTSDTTSSSFVRLNETLNETLKKIQPHLCLFTCNVNKIGNLKRAVESYFSSKNFYLGECSVPESKLPRNLWTPTGARFLWGADRLLSFRGDR